MLAKTALCKEGITLQLRHIISYNVSRSLSIFALVCMKIHGIGANKKRHWAVTGLDRTLDRTNFSLWEPFKVKERIMIHLQRNLAVKLY